MHFINLLRQNDIEIVILTNRVQTLLIDITMLTLPTPPFVLGLLSSLFFCLFFPCNITRLKLVLCVESVS